MGGVFDPENKELLDYLSPDQIRELGLDKAVFSNHYAPENVAGNASSVDSFEEQLKRTLNILCPKNKNIYLLFKVVHSSKFFYRKYYLISKKTDKCNPKNWKFENINEEEYEKYAIGRVDRKRLSEYNRQKSTEGSFFNADMYLNGVGNLNRMILFEKKKVVWFWERWAEGLTGNPNAEWRTKEIFCYDFAYQRVCEDKK